MLLFLKHQALLLCLNLAHAQKSTWLIFILFVLCCHMSIKVMLLCVCCLNWFGCWWTHDATLIPCYCSRWRHEDAWYINFAAVCNPMMYLITLIIVWYLTEFCLWITWMCPAICQMLCYIAAVVLGSYFCPEICHAHVCLLLDNVVCTNTMWLICWSNVVLILKILNAIADVALLQFLKFLENLICC